MKATVVQNPSSEPRDSSRAPSPDPQWILRRGRDILAQEARAIQAAGSRLDKEFAGAVQLMLDCAGRIAVSGMGKAGNIGDKLHATLSSTGTPAYILHPVEALHGDLGMIQPQDILLVLSKSGETEELARLIPTVSGIGCKIVLLTANRDSKCAGLSDIVIDIGDVPEACPLGMAPSSSTAAMLAVGDALALTVMELKHIQPEQYAAFHPGGALGRSLMRVTEIMRTGLNCPRVHLDDTLEAYAAAVSAAPKRAGAAAVVDDQGKLVGIFTHGDLSRLLRESEHPAKRKLRDVMTAAPKIVNVDAKVADALRIMQPYRIDELPVVDDDHRLVGLIDIQDLLARGYSAFDEG
ncbi:MAG: KpsF/GutQ family sugar-phosphate isomerase [Phycisphaerae bacterium]